MDNKRYWYTHDESDSAWISEELNMDDPTANPDGMVAQQREARPDEKDDEAGIEAFQQERTSEWNKKMKL